MPSIEDKNIPECELIIGNSNKRFSGVTSTMLQTLEHQKRIMTVRVLGSHHLPEKSLSVGFSEAAKLAKQLHRKDRCLVFHARRNDEMIQALALKYIYRAPIKIVFTSTAQRHHSKFTKKLMSKMDAVISTCNAAANYLEHTPDLVIPHGINTETYQPSLNKISAWESLGLPGKYGIGIFGRVRKQKGIELFVNACIENLPKNPDFTAVIVGQITTDNIGFVDELKSRIDQAGLSERILFLGEQPFEDIPKLFRAMSLVCALSYNEGFGLTVLEALSSGVAVLATEAGAWPDIINNRQVGELVPIGDQPSISKTMGELIAEPERLKEMGINGRQLILDKYRIEKEAKSLCGFFQSISKS